MIGGKKVLSGAATQTHLWRESHRIGWYRAACGVQSLWFDVVPVKDGKKPSCKRCLKWLAGHAPHHSNEPQTGE